MPPTLTVRAFAEMLELPLYEQLRILLEQKYPDKGPALFRVPYYRPAMTAIRRFYSSGRQMQEIHDTITAIRNSTMPASRIENNVRVIRSFERSQQPRRQLQTGQGQTMTSALSGVELKFTPDLSATEGQQQKYLLYNSRQAPITPELAKTTLELVHWVLIRNGINVPLSALEYVDLAHRGRVLRIQRVRPRTVKRAQQNARAIAHLWQTI